MSDFLEEQMRQCPKCQECFDEKQNFCDYDGSPLVDEINLLRAALQREAARDDEAQSKQQHQVSLSGAWTTVTVGILIGVIICLIAYLLLLAPTHSTDPATKDRLRSRDQVVPARPTLTATAPRPQSMPSPVLNQAPSEEDKQLATAVPSSSQAAALSVSSAQTDSTSLNKSPISTGGREGEKRERAIIRMKDGALIEADAAWEDRQGVWYRRGGLVSFVERSLVQTISESAQPAVSPATIVNP